MANNVSGRRVAELTPVYVAELTAAVLLLLPRTAAWGGVFGAMVMVGAIGSHLTKLGVVPEYVIDGETVQNPLLFWLAVVLLALCAMTVVLHRRQMPHGRKHMTHIMRIAVMFFTPRKWFFRIHKCFF